MIKALQKFVFNSQLKLRLRTFKKVLELKSYFFRAITYRLRNLNQFKVYGYDDKIDETLLRIVNHILKVEEIENIEDDLKFINQTSFQDEKLLQLIDAYNVIDNIVRSGVDKDKVFLDHKPKKSFIENLESQSIRDVRKKLNEFIKVDVDEIIDRSSYKISLNVQDIISYITITSTLTFIGGYLYNKIFFTLHGLNISLFFTPSDYVFAAFEQIRVAIISGFFALMIFYKCC